MCKIHTYKDPDQKPTLYEELEENEVYTTGYNKGTYKQITPYPMNDEGEQASGETLDSGMNSPEAIDTDGDEKEREPAHGERDSAGNIYQKDVGKYVSEEMYKYLNGLIYNEKDKPLNYKEKEKSKRKKKEIIQKFGFIIRGEPGLKGVGPGEGYEAKNKEIIDGPLFASKMDAIIFLAKKIFKNQLKIDEERNKKAINMAEKGDTVDIIVDSKTEFRSIRSYIMNSDSTYDHNPVSK
jgi:hypothetical protein